MDKNRPPRVLTIDDELSIREGFRNFLEDYDYNVFTAENGREGLEVFRRERPDLVLVDLRMPEMDGIEVLAEIKKQSQDTPVIVVSGTGVMADAVEALRLGAWDFLLKPVADLSVLLHAVRKGIERSRLLHENREHQEHLEMEVARRTRELERANAELQQINLRLRKIVKTTKHISALSKFEQFGSWLLEEFGRHLLASGGSLYLTGKKGLHLVHVLDPGHAPEFIPFPLPGNSLLNSALEEGKPLLIKGNEVLRLFRPSGWEGYRDDSVLIFPLPDEEGNIQGILSLHSKMPPPFLEQDREIGAILASYSSEALRATRATSALRESQENLAITLDSIGDGVIAANAKGEITRMNPVAEQLTGWSAAHAAGNHFSDVLRLFDIHTREPRQIQALPAADGVSPASVPAPENALLVAKDGGERIISGSTAPIRNKNEEVVGEVLVFRDVSEQLNLEEQLRQSRKMEAIGQLAGGIAHDFNNMLAGIIGSADILSIKLKDDKKLSKYAAMIQDAGNRAAELTQKLLDFSRKEKTTCCVVDTHQVTREAVRILERSTDKRIDIRIHLTATVSTVMGDPSQLENTILNLGINARDAMPDGGVLTISTTNMVLDQHHCNAAVAPIEPGLYTEISVADTGTGIKPDVLEHIFEPFFTTKKAGKGTGLGLASVYGAVRNHQGDIRIYSQPGEGTVFKLYLPVTDNPPSSVTAQEDEEILYGSGCILVVDDEAIIRSMTEAILTDLGYHVILAENGREAVDIYQELHQEIGLVLLDMVMPKMNGRDALKAMQKINPHAKVLLTSGFNREIEKAEKKASGISGFIKKPFRRGEISRVIHDVITKTTNTS
jgi:PAS domain S-box-containing protein